MTTQSRIVPIQVMNLVDDIDRLMLKQRAAHEELVCSPDVAREITYGLTRDNDQLVESMVLEGATVLEPTTGELVIESHEHVQHLEYAVASAYAGHPPAWASELLARLKHARGGDTIDCASIGVSAAEILRGCLTKPGNRGTDGRLIIDELRVYSDVDDEANWPSSEDPVAVRITPARVDIVTAGDALALLAGAEASLGLSRRDSQAQGRKVLANEVSVVTGQTAPDDDAIDLRVDRLCDRVRDNGVDEETAANQLDDIVFSTGEDMAVEAINGGLAEQLRFLLAHGVRDAEILAMIDAMATTGHAA